MRMNVTISKVVAEIKKMEMLREKYEPLFEEVVNRWELMMDEQEINDMLLIMLEASKRLKKGQENKIKNVATFLMAQGNSQNTVLDTLKFRQVLEVFGIMFKYGGLVVESMTNSYKEESLKSTWRVILQLDNVLRKMRREHGKSSEKELHYVKIAFGLS